MKISDIKQVYIETNNRCNMAHCHLLCPTSLVEDSPKFLEKELVERLLSELKDGDFNGTVCFFTYNEPLIEPRLFWFIHLAKSILSKSVKLRIVTNGKNLDSVLLKELEEFGLEHIDISLYSKNEKTRISKLKFNIKHTLNDCVLQKELLKQYDSRSLNKAIPCFFGSSIHVDCYGKIRTCCKDWKSAYTFGDLHNKKLNKIIDSNDFVNTRNELMGGCRCMGLCARCDCYYDENGDVHKIRQNKIENRGVRGKRNRYCVPRFFRFLCDCYKNLFAIGVR